MKNLKLVSSLIIISFVFIGSLLFSSKINADMVKSDPVITWENPIAITYGDLLSDAQLNATADTEGTFAYTPDIGVKLDAVAGQILSVKFTPTDGTLYNEVTKTTTINVEKKVINITPDNLSKIYGEADPIFTYTYTPELISGDTLTGMLGRQVGESIGEYSITEYPLDDISKKLTSGGNYILTIGNAHFTIIKKDDQTIPIDDGTGNDNAIANQENPEVIVTSSNPLTVTVEGDTEAMINVSQFTGAIGEGTLPEINIISDIADIKIPAGNIRSADSSWNGIISAPTLTTITLQETKGYRKTLSEAIEIGFSGAKLTFDKAVKMTVFGQAGKKVGYERGGEPFVEVTNICVSTNDDVLIDEDLIGDREDCKIDAGEDLIIWTKHFTTFAFYTEEKTRSKSIGGYANPVLIISGAVATNNSIGEVLGVEKYNFTTQLEMFPYNNEVVELQKFLNNAGFGILVVDGKFGPKTKASVIKFQIANGLNGDGIVGASTRALLNK